MKIRGTLDDLGRMAREISLYRDRVLDRIKTLAEKVATSIAMEATALFNSATVNVQPSGAYDTPKVDVTVSREGDVMWVVAKGEEAVFIEFGAGVYYNGSAGSSPRPGGGELGLTIGSYGLGKGKQNAWAYTDETGTKIITRGTPARMPMYKSMAKVAENIYTIAREVLQ